MKLTYIFNSCFVLEGENWAIVFDFYKDTEGDDHKGYVNDLVKNSSKRIYVLSSHSHVDHFNKVVLTWKDAREGIVYVLSSDILTKKKAKETDGFFLDKFETYEDDLLKITAFGSTDIGGSFLVEIEGKRIFHAGDLNHWHWKDESTPEEIEQAETNYLTELNLIAERVAGVDLAMFPVDKRLGTDYMVGAEQFVECISTKLFSPMHFGKYYESAAAFQSFAESKGGGFVSWSRKGESIEF